MKQKQPDSEGFSEMRMMKYLILAILLAPFSAQAVTAPVDVWMNPQDSGVYGIGDAFSVDIWVGWNLPGDNMASGAVKLDFDEAVIHATNVTLVDLNNGFGDPGIIGSGFISPIGFLDYGAGFASGNYHLATVDFVTVGAGVSLLTLSDPRDGFYGWGAATDNAGLGSFIADFSGLNSHPVGSATVVPLPAAAWFMLSGMGFLAFRRRRSA